MEIRVDRGKFLAELALMQGVVEKRTTIPVLSHILLKADGDRLSLAATDLDVSMTSDCAAEVASPGGIAVQARKFMEIVRAVTSSEIELVLEDEKRLRIVAGKSRFKINGLSPQDFPTLPDVSAEGGAQIPVDLMRRMISRVIFAVSTEESRFQLNGALMKFEGGRFEMVATDGHRLALVENALEEAGAEDGSVLVPRKALLELQRFEGDEKLIFQRGEHHLLFQFGHRQLICRILEGTFPDYERVIAKDNDKQITFDRKELTSAVQRVALLTGDRARAVRLNFSPEKLTISAANPDLGEAVEEVECGFDGAEFELGVNPDYLAHFLGAVESEKVRLDLKDESTQAIGVPVEGTDQRYLCVIMPMRI